jgi:hypothetical protein
MMCFKQEIYELNQSYLLKILLIELKLIFNQVIFIYPLNIIIITNHYYYYYIDRNSIKT